MREPMVRQGKSAIFWVVVAVVGSCGVCSVLTLALIAFGLFTADAPGGAGTVAGPVAPTRIPTGHTPDLFLNMPGWLPSGQGVEIPPAEEVDGEPRGLWWNWDGMTVFLADGTFATNPRPGGGTLFDLEGQRAQRGATGVGTFSVEAGKISQQRDGFNSVEDLSFDSDERGPVMKIGGARFWPLSVPTEAGLVGTWRTAGGKYIFRADGTYESGHVGNDGAYTLAVGGQGRWVLEGYLLQVNPNGAAGWITRIGAIGDRSLVINASLYDRE
ncbi:MAG: hypothetical protein Q8L48_20545 [Archangium sp.]|nr:hypothetical protein [Archangium sp.]